MLRKKVLTKVPMIKVAALPMIEGEKVRCVFADIKIISHKKTLIIELYDQKGCDARIFLTNEDYISYRNGEWTHKDISRLYRDILHYINYYHYMMDIIYGDEISQKKIRSFFKSDKCFYEMVLSHQEKIRKKRLERKKILQKNHAKEVNLTVQSLPRTLKKYFNDTVMKNHHHLFYKKTGKKEYECYCSHCKKEYTVSEASFRHKQNDICRKCKYPVILENLNQMRRYIQDSEWLLVPSITRKKDIVLRYVKHVREYTQQTYKDPYIYTEELARVFLGVNGNTYECYEILSGRWIKSTRYHMTYNYYFGNIDNYCEWCYLYPKNIDEIFHICNLGKYLEVQGFADYISGKKQLGSILFFTILDDKKKEINKLFEKLLKLGYFKLAEELLFSNSYWNTKYSEIFDLTAKSFTKLLKLSKPRLKLFNLIPSYQALKFLQQSPDDLTSKNYMRIVDLIGFNSAIFRNLHGMSLNSVLNYFEKNKVDNKSNYFLNEWSHYVDMIKEIGYPLNKMNVFPKDFRKADLRVAEEYADMKEKLRIEMMKQYNINFKKMSEALKGLELSGFMNGASGLQIVIPRTAEDLREESRQLGHCVSTYIDRVAQGKTSIFFIRKIDSPDKSYYTMEYRDGEIKQLYGKRNTPDNKGDVTAFANAFCALLNKINWQPQKIIAA